MDSNCPKRRGLAKKKLMSFFKYVKPSSSSIQCRASIYSTNHRSQGQSPPRYAYPYEQDYVRHIAAPGPKMPQVVAGSTESSNLEKKLSQLTESLYGVASAEDGSVDHRAASYISSVQERFKLERSNSERVKNQETLVEVRRVMNEEIED